MNNNLYQFIKTFKNVSLAHSLVNQFTEGDVYENLNNPKSDKYADINLMVESVSIGENIQTVNGVLFYVDRLLDDNSNKLQVQTVGIRTLQSVLNYISEHYDWDITTQTYQIFEEKFTALCAGCFVNFSITLPKEEICSDDTFVPSVIHIEENGIYNVEDYDFAEVDVIPRWGTIIGDIYEQVDLQAEFATKEDKVNKVTEISENSTDTEYPSAKAVYNKIKDIKFNVGEIEPTTTNFIQGEAYEVQSSFQRVANLFAGFWSKIQDILGLIPSQATTSNQLADKAFVNATIQTNTANFRGSWATWATVPTDANLYPADYAGNRKPTNNDYMVVQDTSGIVDEFVDLIRIGIGSTGKYSYTYEDVSESGTLENNQSIYIGKNEDIRLFKSRSYTGMYIYANKSVKYNDRVYNPGDLIVSKTIGEALEYFNMYMGRNLEGQWRFIYTGDWDTDGKNGWHPSYQIGTAFTQAQQAALDSNITAEKVTKYEGYEQTLTSLQTNKVSIVNVADKIYGTDAGGLQTVYDLSEFGGAAFPKIIMPSTTTTATLQPNTFYEWGEVGSLDISLGDEISDVENKYLFQFNTGAALVNLTLPDNVAWYGDTFKYLYTKYIVSIQSGIAKIERYAAVRGDLPSDYQPVMYLQSDGNQYIRTDYIPNAASEINIKFKCVSPTADGKFFGSRTTTSSSNRFFCGIYNNVNFHIGYGSYNQTNVKPISNDEQTLILRNGYYSLNEVSGTFTTNFTSSVYPMALFAINTGGQILNKNSTMIMECRLIENGVAVRNFVPCYRKSDNVAGMYETVRQYFYTNDGTGSFIVGSDVN